MNTKVWIPIAVLVLVALGYGVWASSKESGSPQVIRIGAALSLTGSAASDGLSIQRGLELAKEDLAREGIVVDINYQDDATDPTKTISALQYLFATYKPQAIVGPTWSFLESAAGPSLASGKVVAYAPANTSEYVEGESAYQFHGAPRNALIAEPVAAWLKEKGIKRVAIVVDNSAWGKTVAAAYRAAAKDAGAEVVVDEATTPFSSESGAQASTAVLKAKNANAEVILWTGYEAEAVAIAKRRHELKFAAPVLSASTMFEYLYGNGTLTAAVLNGISSVEIPISDAFKAKYKAKYGEEPGNYADRAYDGMMLLVEAIREADGTDGDSIAKYLREDLSYEGFGGEYEFNQDGDLKEGKWVIGPVVE